MRRIKLCGGLAALALAWLLALPATAEAADTVPAAVPYPPRTFLYIVDCSGSMNNYQEVLNQGRQILLDLLPENTIVVPFTDGNPNKRLFTENGSLVFDKYANTSILAGIREADRTLEELWANDPGQQVTAVLFSDLYSTVEAGSSTPLVEGSEQCNAEIEELGGIARRWSGYVMANKLRFYTLNWPSASSNGQPSGVYMPFPVPSPSSDPLPFVVPTNADILKICVEVYAAVLTGRSGGEWEPLDWSGGTLTVELDDWYRKFLYVDQTTSPVDASGDREPKSWFLTGGCLLLVEGGTGESCTIEGIPAGAQVLSFTIPQPKLETNFSTDPMPIFDPVSISVAATDGKNYLGYDDSNSICFLEVTAPGETIPQVLSSSYNPLENCHEFTFTAEALGSHKFKLTYMILGANTDSRELSFEKEAVCTPPAPNPQQFREYTALSQKLINLEQGGEVQFSLSSYYEKPNIRLEFVVEEPGDNKVAAWNPTADETGTVTVQGNGAGSTVLRYTINCYLDGESVPCASVEHELSVSVKAAPSGPSMNFVLIAAGLTLFAAVVVIAILVRKKHMKQEGGAADELH